jgi:Glyoxalase-like domain
VVRTFTRLSAVFGAMVIAVAGPAALWTRSMKSGNDIPIDHVIVAIDSLERGIALLERATGVRPIPGGEHPGRGTHNALLGLGAGRYLELIAPNPNDTSALAVRDSAERIKYFGQMRQLTPIGWAVHVQNAAAEQSRLRQLGFPASAPKPGRRARPSGPELRWDTIDPWGEDRDILPFVIAWAPASPHPSTETPQGCTLLDLHIATPAPDSIAGMLAHAGWPLRVVGDAREELRLTLQCPAGRVQLP